VQGSFAIHWQGHSYVWIPQNLTEQNLHSQVKMFVGRWQVPKLQVFGSLFMSSEFQVPFCDSVLTEYSLDV
jgi:hypothetical protein